MANDQLFLKQAVLWFIYNGDAEAACGNVNIEEEPLVCVYVGRQSKREKGRVDQPPFVQYTPTSYQSFLFCWETYLKQKVEKRGEKSRSMFAL